SETTAATSKAVKAAYDLANKINLLGHNGKILPVLTSFNQHNENGRYQALGAGTPNPTPGVPSSTGNARLTVDVRCDGIVTHYVVVETNNTAPIIHTGEYYNNENVKWTTVIDSKKLSSAINSASESTAATSKAVKTTYDLANKIISLGHANQRLPLLTDFKKHNDNGRYYAVGKGASNATPNCPPETGNNRLTVDVRSDGQ